MMACATPRPTARPRRSGCYALSGKVASFMAPALIALATTASGSQRLGIAPLVVLFLIGLVPAILRQTEGRGGRMMLGRVLSSVAAAGRPGPGRKAGQQAFRRDGRARRRRIRCRSAPMPRAARPGLVELPETGPTWQAMRLSRNRNFGQPEMIALPDRPVGHGRGTSAWARALHRRHQPAARRADDLAVTPATRSGWMPTSGCCRRAAWS